MRRLFIKVAVAALAAGPCFAHEYIVGSLRVHHPVTEATRPNQSGVGVYMDIANDTGTADRLVSVSCERASEAMLHTTAHGGSGMRAEAGLDIPAKGRVSLKASGAHIMLSGLTRPLKAGERFPLRLVFKKAGAVLVDVQVDAATR